MHLVFCANFDETTSSILTGDSSVQDPIWQSGRRFEPGEYDFSRLIFQSETPHVEPFPDFSRDGHGCPVMSTRLKELLTASGIDNVDYYPASIIEYENDEPRPGYWAANVVGLVNCMDRNGSVFTEMRGRILNLQRLSIDENEAVGKDFFRLADIPRILLIDKRFKGVLEDNGITGTQLIELDRWDGFDGYR